MGDKLELHGILPAMITPFTADGAQVDSDALADHTRNLIDAGVGGLIPGGSTGEFVALSRAERELVHSTVIAAAEGRVPVVPQTGALTVQEAIALSVHAEKAGAAGVMVAPPFYDPLSFAELHAYFSQVAGAISIPVMLYHIPSVTGQDMSPAQIAELAEIPGVASIKDSSGDASALTELLQMYGDRLQVCNGWDTLTFFGLASGAKASVWGAANIFPGLAVELFDAVAEKGDLQAGRALWSRIYPIVRFLEAESYTARVKAASQLVGVPAGPARSPYLPLSAEDLATLRDLLQAAGLKVREHTQVQARGEPRAISVTDAGAQAARAYEHQHRVAPQCANDARSEAARLIAARTPGELNKIFFTNGGADTAINLTGDPRRWPNDYGNSGVVHFFGPFLYRSKFHADAEAEKYERALANLDEVIRLEGPSTIAAIVLESIPGVQQLCDRYGITMIADEVMAGFGRSGKWFSVQHFDVTPVADSDTREPLAPYGSSSAAMNATLAACKEAGLLPFANFNRIHVVPPCTVTEAEARQGLAILDRALDIADAHL